MKATCIAAVFGLISSSAMADTLIGAVVQPDFTGATGARNIASASLEELHFNRDVFAGETVKTPADGSTVIRFQDSTQIQVGHRSTVVLDKFVYDPQTSAVSGAISFTTGVFRFVSGNANDSGVQLTTPTTSIAIRGTKLLVSVGDDGSSDVGVIQGSIDVKPCGGSTVTLTQGQAVRVSAACNGAAHISLAEVPVDSTVASDFNSPSIARNSSSMGNPSNAASKGGTEGIGPKASPSGDPDHDGDKDGPGEN